MNIDSHIVYDDDQSNDADDEQRLEPLETKPKVINDQFEQSECEDDSYQSIGSDIEIL